MCVPFLTTSFEGRCMKHIVIIGNGIAGVTAARHIRKGSEHHITIISSETPYFFSRTALMYVYMGHMTFEHTKPYPNSFWKKNRIDLKQARVDKIDSDTKNLVLDDGSHFPYDTLILALGSKPNTFNWPGEHLEGVQGLYSYQDLQKLEKNAPNADKCQRAVVVGGGLIGIELVEMLPSRNIPVTFLVRESSFWNGVLPDTDSDLISKHIVTHGVDLRLGKNLREIRGDENGRVKSVVIDETGEEISCDMVGLTTGVRPNIDFLKNTKLEVNRGILVNEYLETNLPDVYAIGDCAEIRNPLPHRRAIEAVWYVGRMMGETVAQSICGNKRPYRPSHWFNSAKFFDIEYQTYGSVSSNRNKKAPEAHFHWKHPNLEKAMTLSYDENSRRFLGINTFGIRLRHEVLEQWLNEKKTIDEIVDNLEKAHFDPEFYQRHYNSIQNSFQSEQKSSAL